MNARLRGEWDAGACRVAANGAALAAWLLLLAACRAPQTNAALDGTPADARRSAAEAAARRAPWDTARCAGVLSNGGRFYIAYRTNPDPIPLNEVFALQVCVCDATKRDMLAPGVTLVADARMPEHDHGMNVAPALAARPDGAFEVQGMLLHMAGFWEVYFDVTRGGVTERAQIELRLD